MNYSLLTFKKKLGLVSFLVLTSLIQITPSIAMDWDENGQNDAEGQSDDDIRLTDFILNAQRAGEEPRLPLHVYIKPEPTHENHAPHSPKRTTGKSSHESDSSEERPPKRHRIEENSVQQPLPPIGPRVEADPQQLQVQAPTAPRGGKDKRKTVSPPTTSTLSPPSNLGPSREGNFSSSTLAYGAPAISLPFSGGYNSTFIGNQAQAYPSSTASFSHPLGAALGTNSRGYVPPFMDLTPPPPVVTVVNPVLPAGSLVSSYPSSSRTQTPLVSPSPAPIPIAVQTTTMASSPSTTTTTSTTAAIAPETPVPIDFSDPVLGEIDQLILKANNEDDDEAQKALITFFYEGRYTTYLTPKRIGFCQWKSLQCPHLKDRCYNDNRFATYAIIHKLPLTSFPNLCDIVKNRAEGGDAMAQFNLARMYTLGYGVKHDTQEANQWLTKSAEQGNAPSQSKLGTAYHHGFGVAKDIKIATDYLLKAAEQGYAGAQNNLAILYEGENNYQKAAEWYTKSANQGNSDAQFNLGNLYFKGLGVDKNEQTAAQWHTKSADQGNALAQSKLGDMYYRGIGVVRDYKKAAQWRTKAADQGNAATQSKLAIQYFNGEGVDKDYQKAAEWHTKAARQGNARSQTYLGNMYREGHGVEKNLMTAFYYYMLGKEDTARDFLSSNLSYKPFFIESNTSWKDTLQRIATGNALKAEAMAKEKGLIFQIPRHFQKIKEEKNRQEFKLPNYIEWYQQVADVETEAVQAFRDLLIKRKPGFMVPNLNFSYEIRHDYDKQANPNLVDRCEVLENGQTSIYTSFGEENIKLQNRLLAYLAEVDEKFKSADDALNSIAQVFYGKKNYEKAQAKLWEIRDNPDPDLKEEKNKLAERIQKLQGPLEEIRDERDELAKARQQFRTLIRSTAKNRQDDFLKEYPFFGIKKE